MGPTSHAWFPTILAFCFFSPSGITPNSESFIHCRPATSISEATTSHNSSQFLLLSRTSLMALSRILSSLLLLFGAAVPLSGATNSEGEALHSLRTRLTDPTNVLQSWDPTLVNPCTWFHVTCDDQNRVIRLDLGNSNISGSLGPDLGRLKHLQYLELYRNSFDGKIPEELGNLMNLVSLDLFGNLLEGNIPKSLAKLKKLRFLRLNNNKLTGSIPRELTALSNLRVFDVSNNNLCGTIPTDGPFASFPLQSFENNSKINGPELQGLVPYDFGC
ncbi:hypothetical protein HPP92_007671 [Vanilla planifolia]|uniref:Leucine-rich repeat-containing N-terminal plant-type domain-containing protein n=1 Tax=Vanilla planifolia TaxID=51239 RepID=A0A835VAW4_VANPL|nr:hypothetical protein HPP92_007671 [Vanilla planifolia]